MSTKPKVLYLYNDTVKNKFLETIENQKTRESYWNILSKIAIFEETICKDAYLFTYEDWGKAFHYLEQEGCNYLKSPKLFNSFLSTIKRYLQWSFSNIDGEKLDEIVNIKNIPVVKRIYYKSYQEKVNSIINREQVYNLINNSLNWQEAVLVALIFEGVNGNTHEEIINLRVEDCDFINNKLVLTRNDGTQREITVPKKTMDIIQKAINEGALIRGTEKNDILPIFPTNYVIRVSGKINDKNNKADLILIDSRIRRVSENNILGLKFSADNIQLWGMIDYLMRIEAVFGLNAETDKEMYKSVSLRYRNSDKSWFSDKEIYLAYKTYHGIASENLKNMINAETIAIAKEIYNGNNLNKQANKAYKESILDDSKDVTELPDIDLELDNISAIEGKEKLILHLKKERKPSLIRQCKKLFKRNNPTLKCEICGFSFYEVYGDIGIDYIEAHHIKEIGQLTNETRITPKDIILVCSNCHRMLHMKRNPCLKKDELKELIEQQKIKLLQE